MKKILYFISLVFLLIIVNFSVAAEPTIPTNVDLAMIKQVLNKNSCATTLQARLTRADNNKNISGKSIKFYQDTLLKDSAKSNTYGLATLTITTLPGPHSAYVTFLGDSTYYSSTSLNIEYVCNLPIPPIIFKPANNTATRGIQYSYKMPTPKGGSGPPYHFQLGSFAEGAPPMGFILSPDGVLSGITKSPPGLYCFKVIAVDTASNQCPATMCITVKEGLPNLVPFQPAGWIDKIVVSKNPISYAKSTLIYDKGVLDKIDDSPLILDVAGADIVDDVVASLNTYTFNSNDYLYVSKAVLNDGVATITKDFYIYLYVDKSLRYKFYHTGNLESDYYTYNLNAPLGKLSPGTHTVKVVADATKKIKESNEKDNSYAITVKIISVGSGQCTGMYSAPNACGPCSTDAQCSPNYCWTGGSNAPFC